jgi:hypothetical protein
MKTDINDLRRTLGMHHAKDFSTLTPNQIRLVVKKYRDLSNAWNSQNGADNLLGMSAEDIASQFNIDLDDAVAFYSFINRR